ncbi:helix-turn-helix transcriptional regulator [Treponema socranskii subsp. buccale]|jgi:DNA-binding helix-turn-helix protein|uniref:helix-turn-helix domain-containing protein n=1 Tax=Treponema socranskii TaxID=53419 RepID=UPI0020A51BDD|nr:helix-turn-helix transcriptional regulator [Treponema socranskii]UTD03240.1 helix-turn-helix transcriptional regulator [Treponema socranskii subsp. buccale]
MHIFWKNVRSIIDYRGITLKMLASLADVPYSTVTNGKNTERQPSVETASKIASALNKSIESLMCDTARLQSECSVLKLKKSFRKNDIALYRKYESIIAYLEKLPAGTRESIINFILTVAGRNTDPERESKKVSTKEHTAHYVMKNDD